MNQIPARSAARPSAPGLVAGGLIVLAALVFGAGIDWGLPSHAIDPFLFGSGAGSASNQLDSFHLTGVGISQLAGAWEDSANLPADVAAHPITDRSKPVTLLANPRQATADEIAREGDANMTALLAALSAADEAYSRARLLGSDAAMDKAQGVALVAQKKVHDYVAAFNLAHFGNQTEAIAADQVIRARILRRYRLYTFQPDEMISLRALAKMHPGAFQLDPQMYQYGGLWLYPLGAAEKIAGLFGFVTLSSDPTFYLDSPEAFGRLYIVARAMSAAWGIVGALAVFAIVRRFGEIGLGAMAAICFICLPVVVDLAHEAKPHLAGAALALLAVLAATKYSETGRWKWVVWTGIACGASAGMVLWGTLSLWVVPAMLLPGNTGVGKRILVAAISVLIAAGVYFFTNPYVAIHLVGDASMLKANLINSEDMYGFRPDILNTVRLLAAGASWPIIIAGLIAFVVLPATSRRFFAMILALPMVWMFLTFWEHSGAKPGEYARFGAFVDVALMVAVFIAVGQLKSAPMRILLGLLMIVSAGIYSFGYERGFVRDSTPDNSRMATALAIEDQRTVGEVAPTLYITAEPAPYCLPPVNLFGWRVVLLPRDGQVPSGSGPGILVRTVDEYSVLDPKQTPISWANKPFSVSAVGGT